jgi:hypothetical protein
VVPSESEKLQTRQVDRQRTREEHGVLPRVFATPTLGIASCRAGKAGAQATAGNARALRMGERGRRKGGGGTGRDGGEWVRESKRRGDTLRALRRALSSEMLPLKSEEAWF